MCMYTFISNKRNHLNVNHVFVNWLETRISLSYVFRQMDTGSGSNCQST